MDNTQQDKKNRPFILIGPDGRALHMQSNYQDPSLWETIETENSILLVAHPGTVSRKKDLLEQITGYVDDHLSEKITLKAAADYCGVSISTVTQLFQKRMNTTFHNYLTQQRMWAAADLIRSGIQLEEIGKRVGYGDHSSFYRAFKQTYGISPREYRKQLLQQEPAAL